MDRPQPKRLQGLVGVGVDWVERMEESADQAADQSAKHISRLRMENLDVDVPPDPVVGEITSQAARSDDDNSYLPLIGQRCLRDAAAAHVSRMTGSKVQYTGEKNCVISAGGLSGILNTLLATVEDGDGVIMTDPTYSGFINRVKLAGGVHVFIPLDFQPGGFWSLNRERLRERIKSSKRVTTMLLMSPGLPSGTYFDRADWLVIAEMCRENDILLIYDTAMERLLFDGREVVHPASLPGMYERTITVGSASKELRMIGWRVGWVVGPQRLVSDIGLVGTANVVVPVGIAQRAAAAALERSDQDVSNFTKELQARRDVCMQELKGLPVGVPAGGYAFVLRVGSLGWTGKEATQALLQQGVCITSMDGWGEEHTSQYVRFVFSNEPRERLKGLGAKVKTALKIVE